MVDCWSASHMIVYIFNELTMPLDKFPFDFTKQLSTSSIFSCFKLYISHTTYVPNLSWRFPRDVFSKGKKTLKKYPWKHYQLQNTYNQGFWRSKTLQGFLYALITTINDYCCIIFALIASSQITFHTRFIWYIFFSILRGICNKFIMDFIPKGGNPKLSMLCWG